MSACDEIISLGYDDPNKEDWRGTPDLWAERLLDAGIGWTGRPADHRIEPSPEADHEGAPSSAPSVSGLDA